MMKRINRSQLMIIVIFSLAIIPFSFAWYLTKNPELLKGSVNRGELLDPVITTKRSDFSGFDQFSTDNIKEIRGRWIFLNIIPGNQCNDTCKQALYKSKQLRLMLNKNLTRTRRAVLLLNQVEKTMATDWWKDDIRLLRLLPSENLRTALQTLDKTNLADGMLLIMDPLGNLMMRYAPGFDPYDVKKDLHRLFKVSQIG